jgi:hypothetical protein
VTPNTVHGMHRRASALLLVAVAALLAGACTDDGSAASDATTTEAPTSGTGDATTTSAADTSTSDTAAAAPAEIVLRGDGLGVVDLGADPAAAVAAVTAALGEPTLDTGWESSSSSYGTCPGQQIRGVEWEHLVLLFTDGDTAYGTGEHLFTWRITGAPPALGTARGLGYQATVADAEELYPGDVEVTEPDEPFPGFLTIAGDGGVITGYLDGDVITNLEAGAGCGE